MTGEVEADEEERKRKWEAIWSYRANPPMEGPRDNMQCVPLSVFLAGMGLAEEKEVEAPEISNEEFERLAKQGRMGLFPPGV